jgi:hypothetical protein
MKIKLRLENLETRETPSSSQLFAVSQDGNDAVTVYANNGPIGPAGNPTSFAGSGRTLKSFNAYDGATPGVGVRLAVGDVTGDGIDDVVTVPTSGTVTRVRIFDGSSFLNAQLKLVREFFPFGPAFNAGAFVAIGNVDISGGFQQEIVVGTDGGGPATVNVFNSAGGVIRNVVPFGGFGGSVRVASGDANGDGRSDIICAAGPGGGPHVKIYDSFGSFVIDEFFAYDPGMLSGVYVAAGELDGVPNRTDIATGPGEGASPHVKVWSAAPGQRYYTKAEAFTSDARNLQGQRVGIGNLDLRSNRQSLYVGDGPNVNYALIPQSTNSERRLRPFSMDDFVFGVPVQSGTINAVSRLVPENINIFDPFFNNRTTGGLYPCL